MRRLIFSLLFTLLSGSALAQGCGPTNPNCIVPTAPAGTNDNRAASTAFVAGTGASGGFLPLPGGTMRGTINWTSPVLGTVRNTLNLNSLPILLFAGGTNAAAPNSDVGLGAAAMASITPGAATNYVTAVGYNAANALTTADHISAFGAFSCASLQTAVQNTCLGIDALRSLTTGSFNTVVGEQAGNLQTTLNSSVLVGFTAGSRVTGTSLVAVGNAALIGSGTNISTGNDNTAVGAAALTNIAGAAANNTAVGTSALSAMTTPSGNTMIGSFTGSQITTGSSNTFIGFNVGNTVTTGATDILIGYNGNTKTVSSGTASAVGIGGNTVIVGTNDVCVGHNTCGATNTDTLNNVAVGVQALKSVTSGGNNTAIGGFAGDAITTGAGNTFVGTSAGTLVTTTSGSTGIGASALLISTGADNTALGNLAGSTITTGANNTIIGFNTGNTITTGSQNILVGYNGNTKTATNATSAAVGIGGNSVIVGSNDVCIGTNSCGATTNDNLNNVAVGTGALKIITSGGGGVALGANAGAAITSGANNIAIGNGSGASIATGAANIVIGLSVDTPSATDVSNTINIGNVHKVTGWNAPTTAAQTLTGSLTLPNIATDAAHTDSTVCQDTTTHTLFFGSGAAGICLGTSSMRFKHSISPLAPGLIEVAALKPDRFFYKEGFGGEGPKYGFMAEDVVQVLPELVGHDIQGRPNTVDWAGMVPVLVKAIQELKAEVDQMKAERASK